MSSVCYTSLRYCCGMIDEHARLERLRAAIAKAGSQAELGRKLGYKSGTQVGHMLNGRSPISEKTIDKIEALHGFAGWFNGDSKSANEREDVATVSIPMLAGAASMGGGEDVTEGDVIAGYMPVTQEWLQQRRVTQVDALRLVQGRGSSMEPTFKDGDLLLVNTAQRDAAHTPGVYVLRADGQLFVKRVQHGMNLSAVTIPPSSSWSRCRAATPSTCWGACSGCGSARKSADATAYCRAFHSVAGL